MKKRIGWILVVCGVVAHIAVRLILTGSIEQATGFAVLLAPLVGLYLLVDSYLKLEDGNVLMSFRPPRFWR